MMKLYENVVIGNFLYGLGFTVRSCMEGDIPFPSIVNLLQQTPVDRELADVLLTFPGQVRLIEFKMKGASLKKEKIRHRALMAALSGENEHLIATSRGLHWYIEVSTIASESPLVTRVVPYLDAFSSESDELAAGNLERFIEQTARTAVSGADSQSRTQAELYLRMLRLLQVDEPVDAGGLLLVMNAGGGMHFAQLRDICDLSLTHEQWLDLALRGPKLEPQMQSRERRLERSYGPDYGM